MQRCLGAQQVSLFFVKALGGLARQFFRTRSSSRMTFDKIIVQIFRHINSETRIDSRELTDFMSKCRQTDYVEGWTSVMNPFNALSLYFIQILGDYRRKLATCTVLLFSATIETEYRSLHVYGIYNCLR